MKHKLKTIEPFYTAVATGLKTFEVRKNDRDFKAFDTLILNQVIDEKETGKFVEVEVIYILKGGQFGIEKDYIIMRIDLINPSGGKR